MAKHIGVVIFNDDYFSNEGLAALKWASDFLPRSQLVRILLVKKVDGQSQTPGGRKSEDTSSSRDVAKVIAKENSKNTTSHSKKNKKKVIAMENSENTGSHSKKIKKEDFKQDDLFQRVLDEGKNNGLKDTCVDTYEGYIKKLAPEPCAQEVFGRSYVGLNIQEILEVAIEDFQLDVLVLGMAAVGSTRTGRIDLQLNSKCSVVLAMTDPEPLKKTFKISAAVADDGASKTLKSI